MRAAQTFQSKPTDHAKCITKSLSDERGRFHAGNTLCRPTFNHQKKTGWRKACRKNVCRKTLYTMVDTHFPIEGILGLESMYICIPKHARSSGYNPVQLLFKSPNMDNNLVSHDKWGGSPGRGV